MVVYALLLSGAVEQAFGYQRLVRTVVLHASESDLTEVIAVFSRWCTCEG
jgi:hypothetical protein